MIAILNMSWEIVSRQVSEWNALAEAAIARIEALKQTTAEADTKAAIASQLTQEIAENILGLDKYE